MEIIGSSDKIAEQAKLIADNIVAKIEEIGNERSYISQYARFPFLSHPLFFNHIFTTVLLIRI